MTRCAASADGEATLGEEGSRAGRDHVPEDLPGAPRFGQDSRAFLNRELAVVKTHRPPLVGPGSRFKRIGV